MRPDADIKRDVENELRVELAMDATDIAVTVNAGVVTLTGIAPSYEQKMAAENAAKRVVGVVGVANDIGAAPPISHRPDPEIAHDVASAIRRELPELADRLKIIVRDGWVTLQGQVGRQERDRVEALARSVPGTLGTTSAIHADQGDEYRRRDYGSSPNKLAAHGDALLSRSAKMERTMAEILAPGTRAPDFTLHVTPDQTLTLSEFAGRRVILAFYPADWSPVCGDQVTLYNQILPEFRKRGAELLGLSVDGAWCHQAYARDRNLHFALLSDFEPKGEVARAYGVYRAQEGVAERALFVIDENGMIFWSYRSPIAVNPGADGILEALDRLCTQEMNHGGTESPRNVA